MNNIVLIGMSGCGKSSVGKALAERMGFAFADTDAMVEQEAGMPISEIFAQFGEPDFRRRELAACKRAAEFKGTVIATGGGIVLFEQAMAALARHGTVVFIYRDIASILQVERQSRPLFNGDDTIKDMYKKRYPLYVQYADIMVENQCMEDCVAQLIQALGK